MAYIDGFGNMHDGPAPAYDNANGQIDDPEPWLPTTHRPPRLRDKNVRRDVQYCPKGYWATKEGALLRIRAMSDSHLANAMAFLEMRSRTRAIYEIFAIAAYTQMAPEHAADAAEEAAAELAKMAHDPKTDLKALARLVWPKYKELEREWTRRTEELCQSPPV